MKQFATNIVGGIVGSLIFALIVYFMGYLNIIPKIGLIHDEVKNINTEIKEIKNNYLSNDTEGVDIMVGVSSEANNHLVIIFSDNSANLKYSDPFELYYSVGKFSPKLKLLVSVERSRNEDRSRADMFISKEAAEIIGFRNYQKAGIVKMKARKLKQTE
jgi:hypothetical protein